MYCRSCHAHLSPRDRTCPSCGRKTEAGQDLGSASASDADSRTDYPLPPPTLVLEQEAPVEETLEQESPRASRPAERRQADSPPSRTRDPQDDPDGPSLCLTELAPDKPAVRTGRFRKPDRRGPPPAAPARESRAGLGGEEVRRLVAERPELIEAGLRVHTNADGEPVGIDFSTAVGPVDLLARDTAGGWVVVLVSERGGAPGHGKELVGDLLQRMGWVRKHLGGKGQEVRGIVLVDAPPEDLGYAAAAVADTVEFKRYRLALTFEPVEVF